MKGYIYTMYKGADPAIGWDMTDPIFKGVPSMGACRPDIRRKVEKGDYIFAISGRVSKIQQHIVGGFAVDKKINALAAYELFPENRLLLDDQGLFHGNIIVDEHGNHIEYDQHSNWKNRVENYIIGTDAVYFEEEKEIRKAKDGTLDILNQIFDKNEERLFKIIGRFGKELTENQVQELLEWMEKIKKD